MAAVFCNLNKGSGLKKFHHCSFMNQSYATRFCHVAPFSNASQSALHLCCGAQIFFHRTHRRQLELKKQRQSQPVISGSRTDYADNTNEGEKDEDVPKATLIWRAIKLPIYSVALIPLTVGAAAAYMQTGVFSARRYFVLLASSILIITWLNLRISFSHLATYQKSPISAIFLHLKVVVLTILRAASLFNDVYDFDTGADKNKKESVVNLVGSRSVAFIAAYSSLGLGFIGLTWTSIGAGNIRAILFLACAIICGYIYQCPPFRLSYQGLGEPLCFAAFGPFTTTAFYSLLGSASEKNILPLSGTILSASLLVGFTTTLILFCSHFHQVEGDMAIGKYSPLVRLGTERGSEVVKVAIATLYSLLFAFGLSRFLPFTCILLCALTLPMGKLVVSYVEENHKDKGKIFMAKYYCVRLHSLFGAALAAGLVAARMFS